ncbi:hypothetical protein ANN_26094 [Periplaneta americana]|uniref:Reverse transcriptase domain-containing protein n=1 Tax=Periplaneta americana TaxID=6978 RepID=A0ABQ8S588_PERAM|nr:hypothetical protein ANN_26094 [Periplaneta americana]
MNDYLMTILVRLSEKGFQLDIRAKTMEMALANIKTLVVPHETDDMSIKRDDLEEGKIRDNVISNDDNTTFRKDIRSPNKYDLPVSEGGGSRTPMPSSPAYDSENLYEYFAVIQPGDVEDIRESNNEKVHHLEENALKKWNDSCRGMDININDHMLHTLLFADDQVIVGQDQEDIEYMFRKLNVYFNPHYPFLTYTTSTLNGSISPTVKVIVPCLPHDQKYK